MERRIWVRRRRSDGGQSDAKRRGRWACRSSHPLNMHLMSIMLWKMSKVHFLMCQVLHLFQRRRKRKKQEQVKQNESTERVTISLFFLLMQPTFVFTVNDCTSYIIYVVLNIRMMKMRMEGEILNWMRASQKQKPALNRRNRECRKMRRKMRQLPHRNTSPLQTWLLRESRDIRRPKPDPLKK